MVKLSNTFTSLVLSGGGPRSLATMGALHYLDEKEMLNNITEYWGTSAGSIISVLLVIGYTPFEIFHEFFMVENFAEQGLISVQDILETSALCHIQALGNRVKMFLEKKLERDCTDLSFFELYQLYGKKVHIIGANTDTMQGECFDSEKTPLMKIIDAIEISCDLPYLFTKKVYNGNIYVDGGFINNYPINLADNGFDNVIGICVFGEQKVSGSSDYIGWIYRLLQMPIMELYRERVQRLTNKCFHIELKISGISIIDISPNQKKKIEIFSSGYKQMKQIYTEKRNLEIELERTSTETIFNQSWEQMM